MSITLDGTINLPTANNAITVRNEWVLWQSGQQTGNDVQLFGVNGALPRARFLAATVHTLELVISGTTVVSGSPSSTLGANLETNVTYLRETVCAPVGGTDGTRTLVLTLPSGGTVSGEVHVLNFRFGKVVENGKWALATLDISIPGGELS
jgi:hypothetical protein